MQRQEEVKVGSELENGEIGRAKFIRPLSFVETFSRKARFAIVGWGVMAKRIAAYSNDGDEAEVVAIVPSSNPEKINDLEFLEKNSLQAQQCFPNLETLLANSEIDTVVVASPNFSHANYAAQALRAGKDVILEKPATTTLSEALELARLAQQNSRIVTMNYVYSAEPMLHEMAELINQGFIGDITHVRVSYMQDWLLKARGQNWRQQREQVGDSCAVADIGVHAAEAACVATSATPINMQANLFSLLPENELEDHAHLNLTLQRADGKIIPCHIEISQVTPGYANQLIVEVHGTKCGLRFSNEQTAIMEVLGVGESTINGASSSLVEFWNRDLVSPTAALLSDAYKQYSEPGDRARRQANIQRLHLDAVVRRELASRGESTDLPKPYRPSLEVAGVRGMRVIENALLSHKLDGSRIDFGSDA